MGLNFNPPHEYHINTIVIKDQIGIPRKSKNKPEMKEVMGGRKERCVNCGSKKIIIHGSTKKCNTCGYEWKGKPKRKTDKKEKVRF
ncbi:MAG: hypothetical protein OEY88_08295 [Candidatus Bathyarchaeota archaeon]|nr:hypothetical protein [Candidatus Bathyarchaeota archaeon]